MVAMAEPFRITRTMRSRKLAALDFIKGYFARWGHSPSHSEIGAALNVSRQRARELVEQLSDEQQIRKVAGKARGIRLVETAEEMSIADAVLRLRQAGIHVLHDLNVTAEIASAVSAPLSYPPLSVPSELDYLPDVGSEAGKHGRDSHGG